MSCQAPPRRRTRREGSRCARNHSGLDELTLISRDSPLPAAPEVVNVYLTGPELGFGNNISQAAGKSGEELLAACKEQRGEGPTSACLAHAYFYAYFYAAAPLLPAIEEAAELHGDALNIDRAQH